MNQRKQKKADNIIRNEQGVALIYALVVLTVIFALALALLYGVGQVSLMTNSHREQDDAYLQAVTLSEIVDKQLTTSTGGGIYHAAKSYMPTSDSESVEASRQFYADGPQDHYGEAVIRFQNGVLEDAELEKQNWQSKELSRQYLDVTIEVFGQKGGKQSVTTRYKYYQLLDDLDMVYTLETNKFTGEMRTYNCEYNADEDCFEIDDDEISEKLFVEENKLVTMEMAEKWAGEPYSLGTQTFTGKDEYGNDQTKSVEVTVQLKRERKLLGYEGDGENGEEYIGQENFFKRIYTR